MASEKKLPNHIIKMGAKSIEPVACKCGSELFIESTRCSGWWQRLITCDGQIEDTYFAKIGKGPTPKTVKCVECGRPNKNPRYIYG